MNNVIQKYSYDEYNEMKKNKTTDFTIDGKCSECGGCCSNRLPLTRTEVNRLRELVKNGEVKPTTKIPIVFIKDSIDMTCPFLSSSNKCLIYNQRPQVCRIYKCNRSTNDLAKDMLKKNKYNEYKAYSIREEIIN